MRFFNKKLNANHHLYTKSTNGFIFISFPLLLLTFLIFTTIFQATRAQPPPPPPQQQQQLFDIKVTLSSAITIFFLVLGCITVGCFIIYLSQCYQYPTGQSIRQRLSIHRREACGLEEKVIESFPVFSYAEVKDKMIGEGGLECAVCLNEFEDDEMLRLIPKCDHVFHPECIDAWFMSHITCPLCRANLSPPQVEEELAIAVAPPVVEEVEASTHQGEVIVQGQSICDDVVIGVVECEEEQQNARPEVENRNSTNRRVNRVDGSGPIRKQKMLTFGKFRSHSTGHSLVLAGENLERFTLRLPEKVRTEMLNQALLNRNKSCVRTLQYDGSSKGGSRTVLRFLDRVAESNRWGFLSRAFSIKSVKETLNESGSSKYSRTIVKMSH